MDRLKMSFRQYQDEPADMVDKVFQFIQVENEVRGRQIKKVQADTSKPKGRR